MKILEHFFYHSRYCIAKNLSKRTEMFVYAEIYSLMLLHRASPQHDKILDTSTLESEIDSLVYKLYNLTDEEIKIVESK